MAAASILEGQLHRSAAGGAEHDSPEQFLANLNEMDQGHYLKMFAQADGSFMMTNERNSFTEAIRLRRYTRARNVSAPELAIRLCWK